jgi:hypothetical protein
MNIKNSDFHFYIFRDVTTGLEYFYNGKELHTNGLFSNLNGYEYRVFLYFEEIFDPTGEAYKFYKSHYGRGTYNIKRELDKKRLSAVHNSFREVFAKEYLGDFYELLKKNKLQKKDKNEFLDRLTVPVNNLLDDISGQIPVKKDHSFTNKIVDDFYNTALERIHLLKANLVKSKVKTEKQLLELLLNENNEYYLLLALSNFTSKLKMMFEEQLSDSYISELLLTVPIKRVLRDNLVDEEKVATFMLLINIMLRFNDEFDENFKIPNDFLSLRSSNKLSDFIVKKNSEFIEQFLNEDVVKTYLEINTFEEKTYFSKERFEQLIEVITLWAELKHSDIIKEDIKSKEKLKTELTRFSKKTSLVKKYYLKQSSDSEYLLDNLVENLGISN